MAVQPPGCVPTPYYRPRHPADTPSTGRCKNHLETFLALCRDDWEEERVSPHAEWELWRFLECGILAYGFARARYDDCGHDFLIAFSCKGRGICPSCNTRRMAETPAPLADHVLPRLPIRQWVLSLPKRLRYHLQHDREALTSALRILFDAVEQHGRGRCPGADPKARTGAVAFIHRFGSSLNPHPHPHPHPHFHPHFHVVIIDGVFEPNPEQGARFSEAAELDGEDAEAVQTQVRRRILRAFVRRGVPACSPPTHRCVRRSPPGLPHLRRLRLSRSPSPPSRPLRTSTASVMKAMIRISAPHLGQVKGNASSMRARRRAHRERAGGAREVRRRDVRAILEPIGEPATPPRIAQARRLPAWSEDSAEDAINAEACPSGDPLAQPEPDYEYDQGVSW